MTGRSFPTTREAINAVLHLVTDQLGMRSSFLSRINPATQRFAVEAAHNLPGGSNIREGDGPPLPQHF